MLTGVFLSTNRLMDSQNKVHQYQKQYQKAYKAHTRIWRIVSFPAIRNDLGWRGAAQRDGMKWDGMGRRCLGKGLQKGGGIGTPC